MEVTSKPVKKTAYRIQTVLARDETGRFPVILDNGEPLVDGSNYLIEPKMLGKEQNYHPLDGDYLVVEDKEQPWKSHVEPKALFEAEYDVPPAPKAKPAEHQKPVEHAKVVEHTKPAEQTKSAGHGYSSK